MAHEGMYEVLEHEATLELQDKNGRRAQLRKRQRVRYFTDGVIIGSREFVDEVFSAQPANEAETSPKLVVPGTSTFGAPPDDGAIVVVGPRVQTG